MDQGTKLPDSRNLNMGGGSNSSNIGGGGTGKDWFGLSFAYSKEKLDEVQQKVSDSQARNEAAEAAKAKQRSASGG